MSTRMNIDWPQLMLTRIAAQFEEELLAASDEEIIAAAKDLGMNPGMQGSAAFAGIKYPVGARQLREFFGITDWSSAPIEAQRLAAARELLPFLVARARKHQDEK
jgi:hypothetical protein